MRMNWKTLSEIRIPDIKEWVAEAAKGGQKVYIGSDSLNCGRFTELVTVVAILPPGKGGRAAYTKEKFARLPILRERLLKEVYKSTEVALELQEVIPGELEVHIDANPDTQHMSSRYIKELVGLVVGQGFKAVIKPDSFIATTAADHCVRGLNKKVV